MQHETPMMVPLRFVVTALVNTGSILGTTVCENMKEANATAKRWRRLKAVDAVDIRAACTAQGLIEFYRER